MASDGVKPTNQASAWSWVVPVLPAAGRPIRPRTPVPRSTTPRSTSAAIAATAGLTAWSAPGLAWYSTRPSGPVIRATPNGAARRPLAARVA